MLWDVTIERTERITFRVEADSAEQAEADMYGGDEIASRTRGTTVLDVELVPADA